jgi:hypothetical protein
VTTSVTVFFLTSRPEGENVQFWQKQLHIIINFVEVPTVDRALVVFSFCSMAIAGAIPLMYSTLGLSNRPRNCLA